MLKIQICLQYIDCLTWKNFAISKEVIAKVINDFYTVVKNLKQVKTGMYRGSCPNHTKPVNQNLMVFENSNGGMNVYCHAGCSEEGIMDGLGLDRSVLFPKLDTHEWRERQAEKRKKDAHDSTAHRIYVEICILKQCLEGRIFGNDKHPERKVDCWDREKQALKLLPNLIKEYYR